MPEYYLTRAEKEIFEDQCVEIITNLGLDKSTSSFDIIELGAGDGQKTITLLRKLMALETRFEYIPIDISINALDTLERVLNDKPIIVIGLVIHPAHCFCKLSKTDQTQKRAKTRPCLNKMFPI